MRARASHLLLIVAVSAGLAGAAQSRGWLDLTELRHVMHLSAGLGLLWALAAAVRGNMDTPAPRATFADSALCAALGAGVTAIVIAAHALTFALLYRLASDEPAGASLRLSGALAMVALLAAIGAWRVARPEAHQPVALLLVAALLLAWVSLALPAEAERLWPAARPRALDAPWRWMVLLFATQAWLVLGATGLHERAVRKREQSAWPDRLALLVDPRPNWAEFHEAVAVLAAGVLLLGTYQLVRGEPPRKIDGLLNSAAALGAGAGCFLLAHRRWSANLFGLGLALVTLGTATLPTLLVSSRPAESYAIRAPALLNAALFGLTFMAFVWFWLSRFWGQQLHEGAAWTTAGRAIPHAWRGGFLITALATLVSYQMVFWPSWPNVVAPDNQPLRWLAGLAGLGLLTVVAGQAATRANSTTLAALAVAVACAVPLFAWVRWHASPLRGWMGQHAALLLAVAALPMLGLSHVAVTTRWRVFSPPLWLLAMLVLPAGAMLALLSPDRAASAWIRPLVLAAVGGLYAIAGGRQQRRLLLALAAVLLLSAAFLLVKMLSPGRV
ncbi:MAG: hypothetical protein U1A27_08155 [Phycisphaerae bacterium]